MTNNEISATNERAKSNKRRILLLILLLVCTLTLLGSATYAWFTANTKVAIADLDIEVTVADGIEISADAKNWGIKLNYRDLLLASGMDLADTTGYGSAKTEDAGSVNIFPEKLKNISSVGNIDTTTNRLELFNGIASRACEVDGVLTGIKSEDYPDGVDISECDDGYDPIMALVQNSKYQEITKACAKGGETGCDSNASLMAFDIYLKLDNSSQVSLAAESAVKNTSAVDSGLKNTVRVAFQTLGTQPNAYYNADVKNIDATGKAVLGESADASYDTNFGGLAGVPGARRMNSFGNIVVWEPNYAMHTAFGVQNAKNYTINLAEGTELGLTTSVPTNGIHKAIDADNLPLGLDIADAESSPDFFATQKSVNDDGTGNISDTDKTAGYKNPIKYVTSDKESNTNHVPLFTAPAGVTKVRIYIWVEGNDIDTENNATASQVAASLYFTTAGTNHDTIDAPGYNGFVTGKYGTSLAPVWRDNFDATKNDPIVGTNGTETGTETETEVTP